ncbi:MAG TPA: AzlD domain-containing protein [Bellilinea sp.]|nr:AzlD domain-containing protein [Bellilinea sp.]
MRTWAIILIVGALTYLTRFSFIWLFQRWQPPAWLKEVLQFIPIAVLSVFIFQGLLIPADKVELALTNSRLLAGLLAILVAWRTRSALWTIGAGMAALFLLNWVMG